MFNDSSSWPFKDPVSPDVAPDYKEVIDNPIDLTTMRKRIGEGYYDTVDKFVSEI